MTRVQKTTIRSVALATAAMLAFAIQIAAAKAKAKAQGLWVGGENFISEFQGKTLRKSGMPRANAAFGSPDLFSPDSIAFDSGNNLWIAYGGGLSVVKLDPAELASIKRGKPMRPKVILRSLQPGGPDPFIVPGSLAFDRAGDLWISDNYRGLLEFLPTQIKTSGAPSPTVLITAPDFVPEAIRFDGSDNLWMSQFQTAVRTIQFDPDRPILTGRSYGERTS